MEKGLYSSAYEHDACGVGMVVNIHGNKSHELVDNALKTPGNGIVVHLDEIKEARKVLEVVELTDIVVQDNAVDIEGELKVR